MSREFAPVAKILGIRKRIRNSLTVKRTLLPVPLPVAITMSGNAIQFRGRYLEIPGDELFFKILPSYKSHMQKLRRAIGALCILRSPFPPCGNLLPDKCSVYLKISRIASEAAG